MDDTKPFHGLATFPKLSSFSAPIIPEAPVDVNWRDRLRSHLLSSYKKEIHPVKNHEDTVRVDIGMALIHLDLNERTSILEVDGWMRLNWTDEYLGWDPTQFASE